MRSILLSGTFTDIRVEAGKLKITELNGSERREELYNPKEVDFENIVICKPSGNVSISAMHWLARNNVPMMILDYDGSLMNMVEPASNDARTRIRQYEAYTKRRVEIARQFIQGKIKHTQDFLEFLSQRYDINLEKFRFNEVQEQLTKAKSLKEIMGIEGITANTYWAEVNGILNSFNFDVGNRDIGRTRRPMNAVDEVNALLNYGYTYLESIIQRALVSNGLDVNIGFLHEIASGKKPLTYDFVEPYRFIVDWSIIRGLESKLFNKDDFTRDLLTYTIKLKKSGIDKIIRLIQESLSSKVKFKNAEWQWYTVIYDKAREFSKEFKADLTMPQFEAQRTDTKELREKILKMSYKEWKDMGYSKGSLWYMKHNVEKGHFLIYNSTLEKLSTS